MLLSVLLCAAELTLGLLLLLRLWRKLTAVVLTLFILGFTILTYSIYTDPYGGINECGCFGEAVHLSNGATFAKNLILLVVAGFHLWNVFRQAGNHFIYRQPGLAAGVLVLGFFVPLYAYFYLPPFDFLPYNVGSEIEAENAIHLYDTGFNEVSDQVFSGGKPTYMIGIKEQITPEVGDKLAVLYEAYRDGTVNLFGVASGSGMTIPGYADIPVYFMVDVVLKFHIFRVGKVFDTETLFGFFNTLFGKHSCFCFFVNDIICVYIFVKLFVVVFCHDNLFKTFNEHIGNSVKVICVFAHTGNDKRSSRLIYKN